VGGTRLDVAADGGYVREHAWEDVLSAGGGGGGLASSVPRPSWQRGVLGIDNRYSNGRRQLPDVAADADPSTGVAIHTGGELQQVGGTSAAAPFWAAATALVRQYARAKHAGPVGFAAPLLYRLASTAQPYPPFHDVTRGGNRYYQSTGGWDYATGLGSPDVYNLARDAARSLRSESGPR
jgi:kumamolisin